VGISEYRSAAGLLSSFGWNGWILWPAVVHTPDPIRRAAIVWGN